MSTAAVSAPAPLAPGNLSSEFGLAKLAAFAGIALVLLSVLLGVFHPLPDIQKELLSLGGMLVMGSPAVYGGYRTWLKYAHIAKGFEAQARAVAAMIPGQIGVDAQKIEAKLEQILNALPDDPGDPAAPTPVAAAGAAGVAAAAKPAEAL